MRKIRIGNDIQVSWEVRTGGEALSLEGRTLRVWVRSAYSKQEVESFQVEGCVVTFTYPAEMQKTTGARAVVLEDITEGSARRTLCADEAFTLVAHSSEEDYGGCACGCNGDTEEDFGKYLVSLKSNVLVGKPGLSAYDLWLADGHTGTMADYIKWLQQPAADVASSVMEAEEKRVEAENGRTEAERLRDEAETERATNETQRDKAETERETAEEERQTAFSEAVEKMTETESSVKQAEALRANEEAKRAASEAGRTDAEAKRRTAESGRQTAETLRKDAETTRNTAESARIAKESKRIADENERTASESDRQTAEQSRTKAETDRNEAERLRTDAEQKRAAAEQERGDTFRQQAETIDTALKNCETATEGAEKVNVELLPESIRVTDRNGEQKELQVTTPQELVTVAVESQVEGMSVEGIKVNVFLNNGKTPQTYVTNAEGEVDFAVDKGNYYEVAVPEYATAQPISPVGYTAVVYRRNILLTYKPYDVDTSEKVVVTVTKYTDGTGVKWEGKTVKITYDSKTTEYQCDENGQVTTYIPYLKEYTITVDDEDGYLVRFKRNSRTYQAKVAQRLVDITMYQFKTGIFILDADGNEYYLDEWQSGGKQPDEAVAIKIADQQLQQNSGSFMLRVSDLKDMTKLTSKQWCTQNLQFTGIALNGNTSSDPNYWNGEQSSFLVMQEAKERSLSVPAFDAAKAETLEIGGRTLEGFLMSVGQEYVHVSNAGVVRDVLSALFGESVGEAYYKFVYSTNRWTSTQSSALSAWYFTSQASFNDYYGKSKSSRVLPSFAC